MYKKKDIFFEDKYFTLLKGDSFKLLKKLESNSVDMIFADPPYFLSSGGISCYSGKQVSVNKGEWDYTKTIEDRIREDDYIPEDVHLTYESELHARETYISELKQKLREAESDLERFKKQGDNYVKSRNQNTESFVMEINKEYLEKCERVRKDEKQLRERTDKYVSQVIWEFLNKV